MCPTRGWGVGAILIYILYVFTNTYRRTTRLYFGLINPIEIYLQKFRRTLIPTIHCNNNARYPYLTQITYLYGKN